MRLIDADDLIKRIGEAKEELCSFDSYLVGLCVAEAYIDDAPTIYTPTHRGGQWIILNDPQNCGLAKCSVCHAQYKTFHNTKYCPHCGAKMIGKVISNE